MFLFAVRACGSYFLFLSAATFAARHPQPAAERPTARRSLLDRTRRFRPIMLDRKPNRPKTATAVAALCGGLCALTLSSPPKIAKKNNREQSCCCTSTRSPPSDLPLRLRLPCSTLARLPHGIPASTFVRTVGRSRRSRQLSCSQTARRAVESRGRSASVGAGGDGADGGDDSGGGDVSETEANPAGDQTGGRNGSGTTRARSTRASGGGVRGDENHTQEEDDVGDAPVWGTAGGGQSEDESSPARQAGETAVVACTRPCCRQEGDALAGPPPAAQNGPGNDHAKMNCSGNDAKMKCSGNDAKTNCSGNEAAGEQRVGPGQPTPSTTTSSTTAGCCEEHPDREDGREVDVEREGGEEEDHTISNEPGTGDWEGRHQHPGNGVPGVYVIDAPDWATSDLPNGEWDHGTPKDGGRGEETLASGTESTERAFQRAWLQRSLEFPGPVEISGRFVSHQEFARLVAHTRSTLRDALLMDYSRQAACRGEMQHLWPALSYGNRPAQWWATLWQFLLALDSPAGEVPLPLSRSRIGEQEEFSRPHDFHAQLNAEYPYRAPIRSSQAAFLTWRRQCARDLDSFLERVLQALQRHVSARLVRGDDAPRPPPRRSPVGEGAGERWGGGRSSKGRDDDDALPRRRKWL